MYKGVLIFIASSVAIFGSSITDRIDGYKESVLSAAEDDDFFEKFRTDYFIAFAYDYLTPNLGEKIFDHIINNYTYLTKHAHEFALIDKIGSPVTQDFKYFGPISLATLRYIDFLGVFLDLFELPSSPKVVEIGVGFGGQCAVLSKFINFSLYELIDLDYVNPLVEKYLAKACIDNTRVCSMDCCGEEDQYDLFISNYGISECDRSIQDVYLKKVISKCKRGYIVYNSISDQAYTLAEFVRELKKYGLNPRITEEPIQTFPENPNYVIIWGEKHNSSLIIMDLID